MMDRKGGESEMATKRKRSQRLVPLRVMVSPAHIDFINYRADTKNGSQGGVIRELIDMELRAINRPEKLHDEISGKNEMEENKK